MQKKKKPSTTPKIELKMLRPGHKKKKVSYGEIEETKLMEI